MPARPRNKNLRLIYRHLVAVALLTATYASAQFDSLPRAEKVRFLHHLEQIGQVDDAAYLAAHFSRRSPDDSLSLARARWLLALHRESEAAAELARLSPTDPLLERRHVLLSNHARLMMGHGDSLKVPACGNDSLCQTLAQLQVLVGLALAGQHDDFETLFRNFSSSDPMLTLTAYNLYVYQEKRQHQPRRSPFWSGVSSAIIPGSGRFVAGKPHEALHTFLPVVFSAAQAAEGYYYRQFESPHFYVFGAATAFYYVSNIAGSIRAAKRKNEESHELLLLKIRNELDRLPKYY